jgi:hypothetical protein
VVLSLRISGIGFPQDSLELELRTDHNDYHGKAGGPQGKVAEIAPLCDPKEQNLGKSPCLAVGQIYHQNGRLGVGEEAFPLKDAQLDSGANTL